jgi:hypothetical protein
MPPSPRSLCLLSHRILEILSSIGAPVSWYCGRFTSIDGQCFAKSSATSQFDDQSDPAIKKAKATITAKMGNPASVEFSGPPVQMRLAIQATSFAASSGRKTADPGRFYILFQKTRRISAVTI